MELDTLIACINFLAESSENSFFFYNCTFYHYKSTTYF